LFAHTSGVRLVRVRPAVPTPSIRPHLSTPPNRGMYKHLHRIPHAYSACRPVLAMNPFISLQQGNRLLAYSRCGWNGEASPVTLGRPGESEYWKMPGM